ncbi:TPA: hypothetical protein PCF53_005314 [Klebsiella quasipneumoniae]|uniref:hypothetical protein n=1 Tax=Klebsiella TaxID=570 RepID=UPI0029F4878D|nr:MULTISPECIES: hypothetical protein [Klebsiella]EGT3582273.1 hypothetical protein [Klebsiella oxytoca]HDE1982524.1 hypothetical protein [Klebsiella quasipneumoniae]EMF0805184.1 hypothetical protein [Klebsiella aerogenes]MDX8061055.1 hypothetical protein [Klebsiella pneumoniae]MEB8284137.1 hypothetical protein [Klebsiella aerogenes]
MAFIRNSQTVLSVQNIELVNEQEFNELVTELSVQGFTHSSEVSEYIVKNKLGAKYKNISGVLQMKKRGDEWLFEGGFPPDIYARLCQKLKLKNKGSQARPGEFTPYKNVK